jgi:hypothetical protein
MSAYQYVHYLSDYIQKVRRWLLAAETCSLCFTLATIICCVRLSIYIYIHIIYIYTKTQNEAQADKINNKRKIWVTFTYHSAKVRKITNLFKHTDIKIAFKSTNTIHQQTRPKNLHITQDYGKSGIYRLTCKTCDKAYVGQISRPGSKISRTHSLHK